MDRQGRGQVNEELLKMIADESADNVLWLKDHGVEFGKVTFSYNFPTQDPMRNHKTANGSGAGFITAPDQGGYRGRGSPSCWKPRRFP